MGNYEHISRFQNGAVLDGIYISPLSLVVGVAAAAAAVVVAAAA